jgi:hypothetical protein
LSYGENRAAYPKTYDKNPVDQLLDGSDCWGFAHDSTNRMNWAATIRRLAAHGTIVGGAILCAALPVYLVELAAISKINGWWIDELFSLTAPDPQQSFSSLFATWIVAETNPPLYYSGLYAVRTLIVDDRGATLVLNAIGIFAAAVAVAVSSRRAGMPGCGMIAIAAILSSGPVLRCSIEARAYLLAIQIVFVAFWFCGLAVLGSRSLPITSFCVDEIILHLLKIDALMADVEVRRHLGGFVVLRRD